MSTPLLRRFVGRRIDLIPRNLVIVQYTISGAVTNSYNDIIDAVCVPANTVVFMFIGNSAGAANSSFGYTVELDAP